MGGEQQMGGQRVPDVTGARPLNQLKGHQATLYDTWRDPSEKDRHLQPLSKQCFFSSRATMMFTVAITAKHI